MRPPGVEELLVAASEFDSAWQGRAGLDEFISFAREFEFSEYPAGKTVRVLTIHAAKGLDFDMVVLPEVDGRSFSSRRDRLMHLNHGEDGTVQWGLELPPAKICAFDPVLSEACEQETAEESYEGLCLSYVAVTRAKRALYVLARRLREGSHSKDFNRLLHETFGRSESVIGDPNWHRAGKKPQINSQCGRYDLVGRGRSPALADAIVTVPSESCGDQRGHVFCSRACSQRWL